MQYHISRGKYLSFYFLLGCWYLLCLMRILPRGKQVLSHPYRLIGFTNMDQLLSQSSTAYSYDLNCSSHKLLRSVEIHVLLKAYQWHVWGKFRVNTEWCFSGINITPAMSDIFEQVDISPVTRIFISLVVLKNEEQKYRDFFPRVNFVWGTQLSFQNKTCFLLQLYDKNRVELKVSWNCEMGHYKHMIFSICLNKFLLW